MEGTTTDTQKGFIYVSSKTLIGISKAKRTSCCDTRAFILKKSSFF